MDPERIKVPPPAWIRVPVPARAALTVPLLSRVKLTLLEIVPFVIVPPFKENILVKVLLPRLINPLLLRVTVLAPKDPGTLA